MKRLKAVLPFFATRWFGAGAEDVEFCRHVRDQASVRTAFILYNEGPSSEFARFFEYGALSGGELLLQIDRDLGRISSHIDALPCEALAGRLSRKTGKAILTARTAKQNRAYYLSVTVEIDTIR